MYTRDRPQTAQAGTAELVDGVSRAVGTAAVGQSAVGTDTRSDEGTVRPFSLLHYSTVPYTPQGGGIGGSRHLGIPVGSCGERRRSLHPICGPIAPLLPGPTGDPIFVGSEVE